MKIVARYPLERETPVSKLATRDLFSIIGIAAASEHGVRRAVGVEQTGWNACPCAQGLVRNKASERLLEAGFGGEEIERIFELVPLATHNQRGIGTLIVGTQLELNAEDLAGIVERSMSAPVYELLKRPDELFVVEHAHLQPRFVEDSVRLALKETLDTYAELSDDDFVSSQAGQPRDDPQPRRARRARRHRGRAARRARGRRPPHARHDARRLATRLSPTRA